MDDISIQEAIDHINMHIDYLTAEGPNSIGYDHPLIISLKMGIGALKSVDRSSNFYIED